MPLPRRDRSIEGVMEWWSIDLQEKRYSSFGSYHSQLKMPGTALSSIIPFLHYSIPPEKLWAE